MDYLDIQTLDLDDIFYKNSSLLFRSPVFWIGVSSQVDSAERWFPGTNYNE